MIFEILFRHPNFTAQQFVDVLAAKHGSTQETTLLFGSKTKFLFKNMSPILYGAKVGTTKFVAYKNTSETTGIRFEYGEFTVDYSTLYADAANFAEELVALFKTQLKWKPDWNLSILDNEGKELSIFLVRSRLQSIFRDEGFSIWLIQGVAAAATFLPLSLNFGVKKGWELAAFNIIAVILTLGLYAGRVFYQNRKASRFQVITRKRA